MNNTTVQYDFQCDNLVMTDVEAPPPRYHRMTTVRCGNLVAHSRHDLSRVFCPEHQPEANTKVQCHICLVGGFSPEILATHRETDCGGGEYD